MKTDKTAKDWADVYRLHNSDVEKAVVKSCRWVTPDDANALSNDAFLAVLNKELPAGPMGPVKVVTKLAVNRARSLLRMRKRIRRNRGRTNEVLDTIAPSPETDVAVQPRFPEPFLNDELQRRIKNYPRLQSLVAKMMIETPDSTAREIAEAITPQLGRRPSDKVVDRCRTEIRKKLGSLLYTIDRELKF